MLCGPAFLEIIYFINTLGQGPPWWSMGMTLCFHSREHGFGSDSWSDNQDPRSHMPHGVGHPTQKKKQITTP